VYDVVNWFAVQTSLQGDEMESNLSEVERRVKRYWYTDGIGELIGGGMFILLGIYFAAQQYLGPNSFVSGLLQGSLVILLIGGMAMGRWLIKALKSRLTYPRTGYVEYHADPTSGSRRRIMIALVAGMVTAFALVFVRDLTAFLNLTVALTGILVGAILIFLQGRGAGLERFYVLGGLSIALGSVLSLSSLPEGYSLGLFYGLMGLAYLLSGGIVLRRYLQENPLPGDAERERE
jgi:hypothetical protein